MRGASLRLENVSFWYETSAAPVLESVTLDAERGWLGVVGPNGGGKSTLLRLLVGELAPSSGRVVGPRGLLYVPQELNRDDAETLLRRLDELPSAARGALLSHVSRLGSDPLRILQTTDPSPGELRKLAIAVGILAEPALIILDEPTNHLDLPSIECLERALSNCEAALLLVSHDERFLAALATQRWSIAGDAAAAMAVLRVE